MDGVRQLQLTPTITPGLSEYCGDGAPIVSKLPVEYDAGLVAEIVAAARSRGDARRGVEVFSSTKFGCLSCHRVGKFGGSIGPPLADIGRRAKPEEIVESVLWPKRQVKPEYSSWRISLDDGRSLQGYKRGETLDAIQLFDPMTEKTRRIVKTEISNQHELGTLMPDGVAGGMTSAQRSDLARFLMELGRTTGLENDVRPEAMPAEFSYERGPLIPEDWPLWREPVNRDRVYDFYRKEALFFRGKANLPRLLPEFPGLDGGKFGHWGNQNEATWTDGRWSQTDLGTVLSGVFHGPDVTVPKAVCVRLGQHGELAACFNPETLSYEALWRGGFLKLSAVRHGFVDGLRPDGELLPRPERKRLDKPFVYHGFYRSGLRVVFAYRIGDVELLDAPWVKDGKFESVVAPVGEHPMRDVLRGGTAQWPQEIKTVAELGAGRPYAVDTIRPPFANPWKAPMFFGDHDFLPDGSALLCTMEGDVWRVTGLDADLKNVRWRRFASGLNQPLGLVVAEGQVYVLSRDQITRLHDLNGDGEADFYECFSNKMITSPAGHDFTCGLARDPQGRFYTASGKQGLIRISADGQKVDVLATGFRNPDGVGLCPDGAVTVPCSEGDWTPASMICLVKPDASAAVAPHFGYGGPTDGKLPALPFAYLPRGLDNSSGGQVTVPDDRWGPLRGQLIHFSFGQGSHFLVLRDEVAGQPQGAVVPLVGDFRSGVHRGRFNPKDGQLYVSGMNGWGSYTPDDGCFQRVRYTGDPVQLPRGFHVHENGVLISFTQPIETKTIADVANHFAQAWNYRYSPGYGSPEFAPCHAGAVGHESLRIAGVHPIDATTVFVELPALQPVNQLHLLLQVDQGRPQELFITVHRLDKPFTQFPGYRSTSKVIGALPLARDVAMLGKTIPNPWLKKLPNASTLELSAGSNLTYSTRTLRAKAGDNVQLTFHNPDVVPHNWVLVKPGALARIGDLTNKLIADPEAVLRQYVPKSDEVISYTDIVQPGQEFTIYFRVPQEKGRYPYLCTFPGHWMVMNGELIVE
jgi:putative heme-binding domain-containing protein